MFRVSLDNCREVVTEKEGFKTVWVIYCNHRLDIELGFSHSVGINEKKEVGRMIIIQDRTDGCFMSSTILSNVKMVKTCDFQVSW